MNYDQTVRAHSKIIDRLLLGYLLSTALRELEISREDYMKYFSQTQRDIHKSAVRNADDVYTEKIPMPEAKPTTLTWMDDTPEKAVHLLSERHKQYRDYFETKNIRSK